ncbi:MAG TPA: DMT family transporter [Roseiflexaceae bacterium]|nr:DMT family transporter [Roseiflexaceae bacterium]
MSNKPRSSLLPYLVLLTGVVVASSAAIMVRLLQAEPIGMPSVAIAAGRLGLAALILLPIGLVRARHEVWALPWGDRIRGIVSGMFLAVHFASWIASLEYTSVASSVALVSTNPLWVALASAIWLRERPGMPTLVGIALTIGGSLLIAISDSDGSSGAQANIGNMLALVGAVTVSGYFLIGRELQRRVSTLTYIWIVYTSAALTLLGAAWISGATVQLVLPAGSSLPPLTPVLLVLALAVGPQLLGHTAFNWSLRHLSATFIAVALLGEPIGSALLALALFGEGFEELQLAGFVLLLIGIAVAAFTERGNQH